MPRLPIAALLAALTAALPAPPAHASGLQVLDANGAVIPALQSWVDASFVPAAPGSVTIEQAFCFDGQQRSCTTAPGDTIWLHSTATTRRMDLFHELGHRFDYQVMTDAARRAFGRLTHDARPWRSAPNSPHERFAAAYGVCARHRILRGRLSNAEYRYDPSPGTHRRVCYLIRQVAANASLTGPLPGFGP